MTQKISNVPKIWRRKKVEAETGLGRSTIYAMIKQGTFPPPIHLGPRSVGWIGDEVLDWISARIEKSRGSEYSHSWQNGAAPASRSANRKF